MNRRDLLTGLAFAAVAAEGQAPVPASLYIPKPHLVEDRALLHDFMDEYSFIELVTAIPTLRITHIPVYIVRDAGPYGTIYGHISKNNEQVKAFDDQQNGVIVFRGPHSYISPTWYAKSEAVPTWNFGVVHATGKLKPVTDKKELHDFLAKLIKKFENRYDASSTYDFAKLPDSYINGMLGGIVGFEMQIELLEGKFKLGQERNDTDKASMVKHLQSVKEGPSISEFTAQFYERLKKSAAAKAPA